MPNGECGGQSSNFKMRKDKNNMSGCNVNANKCIKVDEILDLEQDSRMIDRHAHRESRMTLHFRGAQTMCKTEGEENWKILDMMDVDGNLPPQAKAEKIKVWFGDGGDEFKMTTMRRNFWFVAMTGSTKHIGNAWMRTRCMD